MLFYHEVRSLDRIHGNIDLIIDIQGSIVNQRNSLFDVSVCPTKFCHLICQSFACLHDDIIDG